MSAWEAEFPILARHMGEWRGEYVHLDPDGREIDRHASHLRMWEPQDGSCDVIQINTYTWPDGREEAIQFDGVLKGRDIHFDNDRISGYMNQWDDQTILLTWTYKDLLKPGNYLYELIQLSKDGQEKVRTWHWMEDDRLVKRTVIRERKVA
ncbi:DUF3598 family protein [Micromonosporaceae bacterium DT55]|uniref:DUF3598 family protein n=1 Tax=Melissospora conviva TaxID=3388432 RepID=UPI003C1F8481